MVDEATTTCRLWKEILVWRDHWPMQGSLQLPHQIGSRRLGHLWIHLLSSWWGRSIEVGFQHIRSQRPAHLAPLWPAYSSSCLLFSLDFWSPIRSAKGWANSAFQSYLGCLLLIVLSSLMRNKAYAVSISTTEWLPSGIWRKPTQWSFVSEASCSNFHIESTVWVRCMVL